VRHTRVLLVEMPRILCDIISSVVSHELDMEVVGCLGHRGAMGSEARDAEPDVVIVGLPDSELPDECLALLAILPHVRILGVVDGGQAFLDELRLHRTPLGDVSPESLVKAIRMAGWGRDAWGRDLPPEEQDLGRS